MVDKLVEDYWGIMPLEELISDNGSEFGAHRKNGKKEWDSRVYKVKNFRTTQYFFNSRTSIEADFLHKHLMEYKMPERDAWW